MDEGESSAEHTVASRQQTVRGHPPAVGSRGNPSLTPSSEAGASAGSSNGVQSGAPLAPPHLRSGAAQVRSRLPRLAVPGSSQRDTPTSAPLVPASTLGPPSAGMPRGRTKATMPSATTPHTTTATESPRVASSNLPASMSTRSSPGLNRLAAGAASGGVGNAEEGGGEARGAGAAQGGACHAVSVLDSEEQMPPCWVPLSTAARCSAHSLLRGKPFPPNGMRIADYLIMHNDPRPTGLGRVGGQQSYN